MFDKEHQERCYFEKMKCIEFIIQKRQTFLSANENILEIVFSSQSFTMFPPDQQNANDSCSQQNKTCVHIKKNSEESEYLEALEILEYLEACYDVIKTEQLLRDFDFSSTAAAKNQAKN